MPLYVRDETVNELAAAAQRVLKTATKTEAIRIALERVLRDDPLSPSLDERLKPFQDRCRALGTADKGFDQKSYFDEMWDRA